MDLRNSYETFQAGSHEIVRNVQAEDRKFFLYMKEIYFKYSGYATTVTLLRPDVYEAFRLRYLNRLQKESTCYANRRSISATECILNTF